MLVAAIDPFVLTSFLGSYLSTRLGRLDGEQAYIVDSGGVIVASTNEAERPLSSQLMERGLEEGTGNYGSDRHYATAPIEGTSWLIISTTPSSQLFSAVSGAGQWIPWLIFVFFAGAAVVAFTMSLRALADADRLEVANNQLAHNNEELNSAPESSSARMRSSSSSLRSPHTTSPSRFARCRCSRSSSKNPTARTFPSVVSTTSCGWRARARGCRPSSTTCSISPE